jgi:hypothetical protein
VPWSIKVEAKNKQNWQQRNVLNPIYQVFQQLVPDDIWQADQLSGWPHDMTLSVSPSLFIQISDAAVFYAFPSDHEFHGQSRGHKIGWPLSPLRQMFDMGYPPVAMASFHLFQLWMLPSFIPTFQL